MSDNQNAASGGIGFTGLLTILFIALKLTHHVDWAWKWVLAPVWIPVAIALVVVAFALVMHLITRRR